MTATTWREVVARTVGRPVSAARDPRISQEVIDLLRRAGYIVIDPDDYPTRCVIARAIADPERYARRVISTEYSEVHRMRAVIAALARRRA